MKKNILSNVYYRLNDPVKIKLAILYVLNYVDLPMLSMELKHIMLASTSVDYLDLCEMIDVLMQENHIKTVLRDEKNKYVLTDTGKEMIDMFSGELLYSVRQSIKKNSDEYFKEEFKRSQVRSEISPTDEGTYFLDVELNEGKKKLFSLSIFAGSRENAVKMRKCFNKNPMSIFKDILSSLNNVEDDD